MASSLASSSRALFRAATAARSTPTAVVGARFVSTSLPARAPLAPEASSSLPGSSPLPAAYRAATPSTPSSSLPTTRRPDVSLSRGNYYRASTPYQLHVFTSRNNTILTLTTSGSTSTNLDDSSSPLSGVVAWVSAGSAGYKGASRGTFDAAVEVSLRMFKKIEELVNPVVGVGGQRKKVVFPAPTEIEVVWRGFGQGRDAVFRTLAGGEGDSIRGLVRRVTDATPLKVGGTRAKKRRVI